MRDGRLCRSETDALKPEHGSAAPGHDTGEPDGMRADDFKTEGQSHALALNPVWIEKRAVVIGPVVQLCFHLHDSHIRIVNPESLLFVVISDAFEQGLTSPQRDRNEMAEDNGVANRERRNE